MILNVLRKIKKKLFPPIDARQFLLSKLPKNAMCAEVGAWEGDFSKQILDISKPKKLYLVDPYKFVPDYNRALFGGISGSQEAMDGIYSSVVTRFQIEISNDIVEMKRGFSHEMLNSFDDNSLDWIYIDGNHTYEFVKVDLNLAWKKVKIGGFVTGDDYNTPGWWEDGVTKAVNEFIVTKKGLMGKIYFKGSQFSIEKLFT